ncbi:MAG: LamG domain-containing protein, partial [Planctomycetales bacterium]|nr:LamG domain-containing protein [Planctomycetales bacterium]
STGTLTGYLNGVKFSTTGGVGRTYGHNPVELGNISGERLHDNSTSNNNMPFYGVIDDVKVWDGVLLAGTIAAAYRDGWGLIGRWKLDEAGGTTAVDSSGIGNDGAYWNGAAPAAGGPYSGAGARAAAFNGSSQQIGVTSVASYDTTDEAISVAAWVRFNTATADQTQQQYIIQRDNWGAKKGFVLMVDQPYSDSVLFRVYNGTTYADAAWTDSGILADEWHHLVGTFNGTTVNLYVDGELKASTPFVATLAPYATGNVTIGNQLAGRIFDARLYNRALLNSEIARIYGLVGWWKLDDASGSTAVDSSLAGKNGTYTGGVTLNQTGPKSGLSAAEFDGSDGHVALPTYYEGFGEGFSMSVWANPTAANSWARFLELSRGTDNNNLLLARDGTTADLAGVVRDGSLGGWRSVNASNAITNDAWHHYAVTVDSTGAAILYVDGTSVGSATIGTPSDVARTLNYIGRSVYSADAYYEGKMYDVRLFNRPMTVDEVATAYSAGRSLGVRIVKWIEIQ